MNFDRMMCLLIFFCYWYDLLELLMTSIYVDFKSHTLNEDETILVETAKINLKSYGKLALKKEDFKQNCLSKLPSKIPLKSLSRDEATSLGYKEI